MNIKIYTDDQVREWFFRNHLIWKIGEDIIFTKIERGEFD